MQQSIEPGRRLPSQNATRLLRGYAGPVCEAWRQLIVEQSQCGAALQPGALDVFLSGLIDFIETPDPAIPARVAAVWNRLMPVPLDNAPVTAVAMVLLGEALRVGLEDARDAASRDEALELTCSVLPDFSGALVRNLMVGSALSPSERHWYEVSQHLTEERERRVTQLAILNEVSTALASTLSLDALYQIIYEQCGRLVDTTDFYIGTLGPGPDELTLVLRYFQGERNHSMDNRVVQMGLSRAVIERGEPFLADDYMAACRERNVSPAPHVPPDARLGWLGVPIVADGRPIGVIVALSSTGPYDEEDAKILAAVARQAGAAMQNARLYAAQTEQANQLRAINQLSRAIATVREPGALLQRACDLITELFGYACVAILMADRDRRQLVLHSHAGFPIRSSRYTLSLPIDGPGLVSHAARTCQPVLVNDVSQDPRFLRDPVLQDVRSELTTPLLREGELLGVIDVQSTEAGAFRQEDVVLMTTIAEQLAIAIENTDLLQEERRRRMEMALVLEASTAANSSLVLDDVIQRVAEGMVDAVGLPTCVIYLYDDEGDRLLPSAFVARPGSQLDTTRVSQIVPTTENSQLLRQILLAGHEAAAIEMLTCDAGDDLARVLCPGAVLAVPFVVKQQLLGLALLVSHSAECHFSSHQLRVASGVAAAAALALENARLYTRSHTLGMAEERIRVARDIHDGIAQGLTAISLHLEAADQMFDGKPDKARARISRALELTRASMDEARRSVLDLRASALQELTLTEALQRRTQQFLDEHRDARITGSFSSDTMHGRLSSRMELSLYRIFEAALDNVARHSGATHIDVALGRDGDDVILTVADTGCGFDVDAALASNQAGGKFGLVSMRERARLLHGALQVESAIGAGTRLRVRAPFEARLGAAPEAELDRELESEPALMTDDGGLDRWR